jgi:RNA polymerase primary sigma factor
VDPPPEERAERQAAHDALRKALDLLPDRERHVLELRFGLDGEPLTLDAVGQQFGVTRERVRQLENGALKKLGALGELAPFRGVYGDPKT